MKRVHYVSVNQETADNFYEFNTNASDSFGPVGDTNHHNDYKHCVILEPHTQ